MMASQIPLREIPVIERRAQDTPRRPYDPFRSRLLGRFQRPLLRLLGAAPECFDAHNRILKPGHDHKQARPE
jgi:hypothetical protein